jgi:hypothetical protein
LIDLGESEGKENEEKQGSSKSNQGGGLELQRSSEGTTLEGEIEEKTSRSPNKKKVSLLCIIFLDLLYPFSHALTGTSLWG